MRAQRYTMQKRDRLRDWKEANQPKTPIKKLGDHGAGGGLVVSVLPFYPTIRVWILPKTTVFYVKMLFEKKKKIKRGQGWSI